MGQGLRKSPEQMNNVSQVSGGQRYGSRLQQAGLVGGGLGKGTVASPSAFVPGRVAPTPASSAFLLKLVNFVPSLTFMTLL